MGNWNSVIIIISIILNFIDYCCYSNKMICFCIVIEFIIIYIQCTAKNIWLFMHSSISVSDIVLMNGIPTCAVSSLISISVKCLSIVGILLPLTS